MVLFNDTVKEHQLCVSALTLCEIFVVLGRSLHAELGVWTEKGTVLCSGLEG